MTMAALQPLLQRQPYPFPPVENLTEEQLQEKGIE